MLNYLRPALFFVNILLCVAFFATKLFIYNYFKNICKNVLQLQIFVLYLYQAIRK